MTAQVPFETALLDLRQTSPDRFALGTKDVDDRAPIESALRRIVYVTTKTPQERARVSGVKHRDYIVGRYVGMHFRNAVMAGENVHRAAVAALL